MFTCKLSILALTVSAAAQTLLAFSFYISRSDINISLPPVDVWKCVGHPQLILSV